MKVSELIQKLSEVDQDLDVLVDCRYAPDFQEIYGVKAAEYIDHALDHNPTAVFISAYS